MSTGTRDAPSIENEPIDILEIARERWWIAYRRDSGLGSRSREAIKDLQMAMDLIDELHLVSLRLFDAP